MNVEHETFTPLVFSLTGSEGPETSTLHQHIAQKYCEKNEKKYCVKCVQIQSYFWFVFSCIWTECGDLLRKSVLICVRGSRSVNKDNVVLDEVSLTGQTIGLF